MILSEPKLCGKYLLESEIARGGMGSIWIAQDPDLKRRVALKRLDLDHASEKALVRFEREARAVARLSHPNVVQVFDYGVERGCPYIVMELLEGEDLSARIARFGRLSPAAMAPILRQAANALGAAHAAGIVHRDVKPANIFLSRTDQGEVVKVVDFGIAAAQAAPWDTDRQLTGVGGVAGTPAYMSPEQARARSLDHRSDLWSLGVVAFQALTGRLPFEALSLGDFILAICAEPIPAPSSVVPDLAPAVDRFFERALCRDPAGRFPSAGEMAAAFAELAEARGPDARTKVMVVDDEPDVRLLMQAYFRRKIESREYELFFAGDGVEALETLRRHPDIDVVLSDIRMPRMDGLELLARAAEVCPVTKVVMVSAYGDMENIRKAMNNGAFDFLLKPVDLDDFEATIEKTARHVQAMRRTIRSVDENDVLRMFVHRGILERLLPAIRAGGVIAGETVEGTVAFLDVCGSHALIERSGANALPVINASFEVIVPEILEKGGIVDKFLGDAVMAVFLGEEHARRAVAAAGAARAALERLAAREGEGSPYAMGMKAGVESGTLVSGAVGSRALLRLDYTVLGRAVKTASHLESIAVKGQILAGEELRSALGPSMAAVPLGSAEVPGQPAPLPYYEITRTADLIQRFAVGQDTTAVMGTDGPRE